MPAVQRVSVAVGVYGWNKMVQAEHFQQSDSFDGTRDGEVIEHLKHGGRLIVRIPGHELWKIAYEQGVDETTTRV